MSESKRLRQFASEARKALDEVERLQAAGRVVDGVTFAAMVKGNTNYGAPVDAEAFANLVTVRRPSRAGRDFARQIKQGR